MPFIQQLMQRGASGTLITSPSFQEFRSSANARLPLIYGALFVVSLVVNYATTSFFVTLLVYVAWIATGYVFIAVGTRPAHKLATYGIALVGAVISAIGMLSGFLALAFASTFLAYGIPMDMTLIVLELLFSAVMAVLFTFAFLQMHAAIKFLTPPV